VDNINSTKTSTPNISSSNISLPNILAIGGSDSSGGAGIQADIIAITENQSRAATAITAITSQNNDSVSDIFKLPSNVVQKQIETIINKVDIKIIKTGMLTDSNIVRTIASTIPTDIPIIIDPVIKSSSGVELIDENGVEEMKKLLFPRSLLVTPNIDELKELLNIEKSKEILENTDIDNLPLESDGYLIELGKEFIRKFGCDNILIKGGHSNDKNVVDILITRNGEIFKFSNPRVTGNFRGTGCRLASAISVFIAKGYSIDEAVKRANKYIQQYILNY